MLIFFFHIPKAGGSTIRHIIKRQYSPDQIYTIGVDVKKTAEDFKLLSDSDKSRIKIVQGHMGYGLHESVKGPTTYFTFLRNPVERVISTYYYILNHPEHNHHQKLVSGQIDLHEFVRQGVSKVGTDNGEVRLLSGAENMGDQVPFRECTREMLAQAKQNLEKSFPVVGLVEKFDESMIMLRRNLGWRMPFYVKINVGDRPPRQNIAPKTLELIREQNSLALELYEFGKELFDKQYAQHQPWIDYEVNAFKVLNRLYGRYKAR